MRHLAAILLCVCALPAFALDIGDPAAKARTDAAEVMNTRTRDAVILAAVHQRNLRHATLTQADIDAPDLAWRAERDKPVRAMIDCVLTVALNAEQL